MRRKHFWTEDIDNEIRRVYRTVTARNAVNELAERLNKPRWVISRRAFEIGATEPHIVLCNNCNKIVGKINIQEIHPSVLVSVVCNDCQALVSCNKGGGMIVKCEWYKIYKRIFNMELNREECNLMQAKCTCGGDTHNCDYPIMLSAEQKSDAADFKADADREEER